MSEQKENFIEAVQNDEYAEFDLNADMVMVTDWEGDGLFDPYIVLPEGHDEPEELLDIIDSLDFMSCSEIEIEEQNYLTIGHIFGAELQ